MNDQLLVKKVIFLAIFASFSACLQVFVNQFIYWKAGLFSDFWRLWTGHWVHVGWIHYLLNMLAFICLPFIFPRVKIWCFVVLLLLLPVLISLSFYLFLPHVNAYAGLSGVLHGIYACLACIYLIDKRERNFAAIVLTLIMVKVLWENIMGGTGTAELIGSPVLIEAHLLGILWGIAIAICYISGKIIINNRYS